MEPEVEESVHVADILVRVFQSHPALTNHAHLARKWMSDNRLQDDDLALFTTEELVRKDLRLVFV